MIHWQAPTQLIAVHTLPYLLLIKAELRNMGILKLIGALVPICPYVIVQQNQKRITAAGIQMGHL